MPREFNAPPALTEIRHAGWKEHFGRTYLYWAVHPRVVFSGEYQYEKFDRNRDFAAGIAQTEIHSFPLGINFYHPCGFSARLKTTYVDQEGTFQPQGAAAGTFVQGDDRFWITDASIGYRLPKRLGLITIEGKNIFDEFFNYYDTNPVSPRIQPESLFLFKLTWAF